MRDHERIEMYYRSGLLDWKNEERTQNIEKQNFQLIKGSAYSTLGKMILSLGAVKHFINTFKH